MGGASLPTRGTTDPAGTSPRIVLYEWWEAIDLSDRDLRSALKRAAATERRRLYGTTGR